MGIEFAGVDLLMPGDKDRVMVEDRGRFPWTPPTPSRMAPDRRSPRLPPHPTIDPWPGRINALWWPTGASRHASFLGLCDKERLDAIRDVVYRAVDPEDPETYTPASKSATLKIGDGTNKVRATMWMLPPRPVTWTGLENNLWQIVLVDERWWWNQEDTGDDWLASPPLSWDNVFEKIRDKLGFPGGGGRWAFNPVPGSEDEIHGDYLYPHCVLAKAQHLPLGVVLDAAAHSVGRRVVIDTDGWSEGAGLIRGAIRIISPEQGDDRFTTYNYKNFSVYGGGRRDHGDDAATGADDAASVPAEVKMLFPAEEDCNPLAVWEAERIYPAVDFPGNYADYGSKGRWTVTNTMVAEGSPPVNGESLHKLAKRWAGDWLHWARNANCNLVMIGVKTWFPDGYNDAVEYRVESSTETRYVNSDKGLAKEERPCHRFMTVLHPWPVDSYPREALHADSPPDPSLAYSPDCDDCGTELPSEIICDPDTAAATVVYDRFTVILPNGETAKLRRVTG